MIVAVSVAIGKSSDWILDNMTVEQIGLYYGKIKKNEFDYQELQARLVWAIANGWQKPKENAIDDLKVSGILEDTV